MHVPTNQLTKQPQVSVAEAIKRAQEGEKVGTLTVTRSAGTNGGGTGGGGGGSEDHVRVTGG